MKRIAIVGLSCSGKTTFACELAKKLEYPHIELDSLFWGQNWTRRNEFLDDVKKCVQKEYWVLDGNYSMARDIIWERVTTVIILNLPFYQVFYRAIYRTLKRILTKEVIFNENVETWGNAFFSKDGIPFWVIKTYRKRKKKYKELVQSPEFSNIEFIDLKTIKSISKYIDNLNKA